MRTLLTFCTLFLFGVLTHANAVKPQQEQVMTKDQSFEVASSTSLKKRFPKERDLARVYLQKNSRVKKELGFTTKKNRTKLA